jgi:hypothetical protein
MISTSISESKDRVKSALLTNGFKFPPLKITVNLSPSEISKKGTHFDLAIALQIALFEEKNIDFEDIYFFGELALDGKIKDTISIFPIVLSLVKQGLIKKVLVCEDSAKKLANIPNLEIFYVKNLEEAILFIKSKERKNFLYEKKILDYKTLSINDELFYYDLDYKDDFSDVIGQDMAKYAGLISAAGNHNIIFEGSPGCGKSMISKRLQYIMPPMSLEEILEKAKLQALDYKDVDFLPIRAFRSPHHSSTKSSIFGGGSVNAKMGEVALSNNGILFFDELPHFSKSILEALREPLEDNKILISRVNSKILYETKFILDSSLYLKENNNYLISLGSGDLKKIIDLEKTYQLIEYLYNSYRLIPIVVLNPGQEFLQLELINRFLIPNNVNYISLDKKSIDEMAVIIKYSKFFIVPDTGLFHMSLSLKTPTFCIFTHTNPKLVEPDNDDIIYKACYIIKEPKEYDVFGLENCTKEISFEDIKNHLDSFLSLIKN